jgi:hypothetical protein
MDTEDKANDESPVEATGQADSTEPGEKTALDATESIENDEDEFVVISPEQAPLELAEKYPQVQVPPRIQQF